MALKAMLPRIIENQNAIVAELDEAAHTCIDDVDAIGILMNVLAGERQIIAELKTLIIS
jgi:hypothetical protein